MKIGTQSEYPDGVASLSAYFFGFFRFFSVFVFRFFAVFGFLFFVPYPTSQFEAT
jgi:hypothetical protein